MSEKKQQSGRFDDDKWAERLDTPLVAVEGGVSLLGKITAAFADGDFYDAMTSTLDLTCEVLEADNAEIFFSEPEGSDLLLTACRGRDREALVEQVRFAPGSGFPGRVTANRQPLLCTDLAADPRYLRQSVVRCGINAYACVPLRAPRGLCGSLNAAWRKPPQELEEVVELLELVASVVSTHIAARLSELRCLVDRAMESASQRSAEDRLELLLRLVVEMTDTPRAAARLLGADGRDLVAVHGLPQCSKAASRSDACPCDAVEGGHGDLVGVTSSAYGGCGCQFPPMMENPGRLSMNYGGEAIGCVVVDFDTDLPVPATRELLPLLVVAQQAALHLRRACKPPPRVEQVEEASPELELFGLGSFRIVCRGELLKLECFNRRAAVDLLKVLALQSGSPLSTDQLVETLWPECEFGTGKNRLHVALHDLRSVLEPEGGRGNWQFVRTRQGHYLLDGGDEVWIDFEEFESLWKAVNRGRSRCQSTEQWRRSLEQMIDLYRDDLFPENLYHDWCDGRRTYLRRLFLKALTLYVDVLVEDGEFEAALEQLRRGLDVDEFDDTLNRRLIEILLVMGRRRRAHEHYELYVRRLHDELGCEPMPATLDLGELLALARHDFQAAQKQLQL